MTCSCFRPAEGGGGCEGGMYKGVQGKEAEGSEAKERWGRRLRMVV